MWHARLITPARHHPAACSPCSFSATDSRCEMELDEVDPARWAALEAATEEYIGQAATQGQFAAAAAALVQGG